MASGPGPDVAAGLVPRRGDPDDVLRRRTLGSVHHLEFHLFSFGQGPETLTLNGGKVDEAVLAVVGSGDEAKTLLVIEPLDASLSTHALSLLKCWGAARRSGALRARLDWSPSDTAETKRRAPRYGFGARRPKIDWS